MSQSPQTQYEQELNSILSVPRRFGGLGSLAANRLAQQFQQIRRKLQSTNTSSGAAVAVNPTLPKQVLSASATQTASKQQDRTFSLVSVSFTRDANDANFAGVRIWFKGFKGNTQWQLVSSGSDSPVSFLEEATGETVQVAVQPFNQSGFAAPFAGAVITSVTLSGVVSAPPAPTVTQNTTPIVGGFQFTFQMEGALLADVIDCYKVYRNTVNTSGSATVIQTIKHSPTNTGDYVVQDLTCLGDAVEFYWVSAVNTVGLESSLTAAQSSSVQRAIRNLDGFGKNIVPNAGFESNLVGAAVNTNITDGYPVCDAWYVSNALGNTAGNFTVQLSNSVANSGAQSAHIQIPNNTVAGAGVTLQTSVASSAKFPVVINDILRVAAYGRINGLTAPAGTTIGAQVGAALFNSAGTLLGSVLRQFTSTGGVFALQQASLKIPATLGGGVPAYGVFFCSAFFQNPTGASATLTSGNFDFYFDDIKAILQATAYELTPINTSGQPQTTTSPLSQSGTSTTINVAATTWQFGDGTVSYNSGSVDPGSLGTWYIYADDPTYSGGAVTYVATSNPWGILASNGYVYFGQITTTGGGSAAGFGGGTGGGGGGGKRSLT